MFQSLLVPGAAAGVCLSPWSPPARNSHFLTLASEMSSRASSAEGLPSPSFNTLNILLRLSIRLQSCYCIFSLLVSLSLSHSVTEVRVLCRPAPHTDLWRLMSTFWPTVTIKLTQNVKERKITVDQSFKPLFSYLKNKQHEKKSHLSRSFAHTCFCFPPDLQDFTLDFYFRQHWTDPRLSFPGRGGLDELTVGSEYLKKIWVPDTFFANEKKSYFHTATTSNEMLRITNQGKVLRSIR